MIAAAGAFLNAIESAGMVPPTTIYEDGLLHRFSPTGKRGDDAGWYVLHLDGVPAGSFGNWRSGESQTWCAKADNAMSEGERQAQRERVRHAQRMRDAETARRQGEAASQAVALWQAAFPALAHPYLTAKGVKPHSIRSDGHQLLLPMRDSTGKLWNVERISPTVPSEKKGLFGGRRTGLFHAIGKPRERLIVCEGYATGATLHEATGEAIAIAFNAGNMQAVAVALRAKYPHLPIILAADDDWKTPGNPGLTAAKNAAHAVSGRVAVPDFAGLPRGDKDTDYNDLNRLAGAVQIGGAA